MDEGVLRGLRASRRGPEVSYLFFADDLILFTEAKEDQLICIKEGLELFCKSSGQKVNYIKSSMICSSNISHAEVEKLSSCFGVPLKGSLGKYLGHHVLSGGRNDIAHKELVKRVQARLDGWQV